MWKKNIEENRPFYERKIYFGTYMIWFSLKLSVWTWLINWTQFETLNFYLNLERCRPSWVHMCPECSSESQYSEKRELTTNVNLLNAPHFFFILKAFSIPKLCFPLQKHSFQDTSWSLWTHADGYGKMNCTSKSMDVFLFQIVNVFIV